MYRRGLTQGLLIAFLAECGTGAARPLSNPPAGPAWVRNDPARPKPRPVETGTETFSPRPPSDAVILFDGQGLDAWTLAATDSWRVENGLLVPMGRITNYLRTKQLFSDLQLHLEFRMKYPPEGRLHHRGNSGVLLMGVYELQIQDTSEQPVFADGMTGSVYGQSPPLVDSSRAPGIWQSFDVVFRAPRYRRGCMTAAPVVTVFLNGVLVQHEFAILGDTLNKSWPPRYVTPGNAGPIALQDHADGYGQVVYRNIWARDLARSAN